MDGVLLETTEEIQKMFRDKYNITYSGTFEKRGVVERQINKSFFTRFSPGPAHWWPPPQFGKDDKDEPSTIKTE